MKPTSLTAEHAAPSSKTQGAVSGKVPMGTMVGAYIRAQQGMLLCGMKKSTWYSIQNPASPQYDSSFPNSYLLSARTRVWKTAELILWVESKLSTKSLAVEGV